MDKPIGIVRTGKKNWRSSLVSGSTGCLLLRKKKVIAVLYPAHCPKGERKDEKEDYEAAAAKDQRMQFRSKDSAITMNFLATCNSIF